VDLEKSTSIATARSHSPSGIKKAKGELSVLTSLRDTVRFDALNLCRDGVTALLSWVSRRRGLIFQRAQQTKKL
jgi:hypothetical protein